MTPELSKLPGLKVCANCCGAGYDNTRTGACETCNGSGRVCESCDELPVFCVCPRWQCGDCGEYNTGRDLSAACGHCGLFGDGTRPMDGDPASLDRDKSDE